MSIKMLTDSIAFCQTSEESLTSEIAKATTESTGLGTLHDTTRVQVVDLRDRFIAKDSVASNQLLFTNGNHAWSVSDFRHGTIFTLL